MPSVEISQNAANMLETLSKAMKGSTPSFAQQRQGQGTASSESSKSDPKAQAERAKTQKAAQTFEEASSLFSKSVNKDFKTKDQWKQQVDQSGKFLDDAVSSINAQSNLGASALDGLEGMLRTEDQLKVLQEIRETFRDNGNAMQGEGNIAEVEQKLAKFGMSLEDIGIERAADSMIQVMKTVEGVEMLVDQKVKNVIIPQYGKLNNAMTENTKNLKKATDGLETMASTAESMKKVGPAMMAAAAGSMKLFVDESRIAMTYGVADARDGFGDTAVMIAKLGVSTSKYMETVAENRKVQLAMSAAGLSWKDQITETSQELRTSGLVGSAEEGLKAAAAFMKNVSSVGVAQKDLADAADNQTKIYKENFRAIGMSTGEFNALTEDLINDVDIKKDLQKLQGRERLAYIESLQKRTAENVMMGYSIERAKELNKHFAQMSSEDPLERLSKAAKERSAMGVLGMGGEGARIQELMTKMPTLNEKEKSAATKEITEYRAEAAKRAKEMMASTVGANVAIGSILRQLGMNETLQQFETGTREGMSLQQDGENVDDTKKRLDMQQTLNNEVGTIAKTAVAAADTYAAAMQSSATFAATAGMTWLAGMGLQAGIKVMSTALTKIATTGMGGAGGAGGKMAGLAAKAALLYGAWEAGSYVGDKITEAWSGTESYNDFSQMLGTTVDTFASLWSDEAKQRLATADKLEKLQEEQLAQTKKIAETAERQAAAADKTNVNLETGTEETKKQGDALILANRKQQSFNDQSQPVGTGGS